MLLCSLLYGFSANGETVPTFDTVPFNSVKDSWATVAAKLDGSMDVQAVPELLLVKCEDVYVGQVGL